MARVLACLLALAVSGCSTRRTITIASDPSGANVWVNGKMRGTTPVDVPFVHPGTWHVRLEKKGYASLSQDVGVKSGIGDYPIIDLPYELMVRQNNWLWTGKMTPLPPRPTEAELKSVLDGAEEFRVRARKEASESDVAPRSKK